MRMEAGRSILRAPLKTQYWSGGATPAHGMRISCVEAGPAGGWCLSVRDAGHRKSSLATCTRNRWFAQGFGLGDVKKWFPSRLTNYSMGLYVFFFGTTIKYENVAHHTIWLTERFEELLSDIFDRKTLTEDFSLYIHRPTGAKLVSVAVGLCM